MTIRIVKVVRAFLVFCLLVQMFLYNVKAQVFYIGTQPGNGAFQEFYINPHKLNGNMWNELAKSIKWSHSQKDILVDSHWIGGDPSKGEVYGFASWNPKGGVLMLRNPSSKFADYVTTLNELRELPDKYNTIFELYNVRNEQKAGIVHSLKSLKMTLKPFEVIIMNIKPIEE